MQDPVVEIVLHAGTPKEEWHGVDAQAHPGGVC
jgi:hypothetical protein